MDVCFRCGELATYVTKLGKYVCHKNASKCPIIRDKLSKVKVGKDPWNKGVKKSTGGHNKGVPATLETRKKISDALHGKSTGRGSTEETERNRRKKISNAIKKRYESGWMPRAGRCKKIHYSSPIAGDVVLDGSWELAVAQYFDENGIQWTRNTTRFEYTHLNGKQSTYTPDFYLYESDTYIEVKGHETNLDRCKWEQFPKSLVVWKRKELKNLGII